MTRIQDSSDYLFTLRLAVCGGIIVIHAWDGGFQEPNHNRINVQVRMRGKVIFPRGSLYCGLTQNYAVDGVHAKELVMSLVGMKPGDTDPDYFASYTDEQLKFARMFGEEIDLERQVRYCDDNGSVRS